jgi:chemotaxis signal transduction protein
VTAVFVPEKPSRFVKAEPPEGAAPVPEARRSAPEPTPAPTSPVRRRRTPSFAAAAPVVPVPALVQSGPDSDRVSDVGGTETTATSVEGYVLFAVGGTTFAVGVGEVREIVRAARLELLPQSHVAYGHGVALVDVRGRAIPVVDLRSDRSAHGDVLLPMWRHQVGLVVDHVVAVQSPRELTREHDEVPAALPSYARGILRPVESGGPVLLIAMPDAAELEADAVRRDGPRLGDDVLADLGLDAVQVVAPDAD